MENAAGLPVAHRNAGVLQLLENRVVVRVSVVGLRIHQDPDRNPRLELGDERVGVPHVGHVPERNVDAHLLVANEIQDAGAAVRLELRIADHLEGLRATSRSGQQNQCQYNATERSRHLFPQRGIPKLSITSGRQCQSCAGPEVEGVSSDFRKARSRRSGSVESRALKWRKVAAKKYKKRQHPDESSTARAPADPPLYSKRRTRADRTAARSLVR